jgi:hypothetical protein
MQLAQACQDSDSNLPVIGWECVSEFCSMMEIWLISWKTTLRRLERRRGGGGRHIIIKKVRGDELGGAHCRTGSRLCARSSCDIRDPNPSKTTTVRWPCKTWSTSWRQRTTVTRPQCFPNFCSRVPPSQTKHVRVPLGTENVKNELRLLWGSWYTGMFHWLAGLAARYIDLGLHNALSTHLQWWCSYTWLDTS